MKAPAIQRNSWLKLCEWTEAISSTGAVVSHFDLAVYPAIVPQSDDQEHTVQSTDRVDVLANTFYGDSRLWWVLAVANGWDEPATSLCPGQTIKVPSPRWVRERLVK